LEGPTGPRRILCGAQLRVLPGRTFALLGESGSGKTLLAHSVLGLHPGSPGIVAGEATLLGAEVFRGLGRHVEFKDGPEPRIRKDVGRWTRGVRRNLRGLLGRAVTLVPQDPLTTLSPFHTVGRMIEQALRMGDEGLTAPELSRGALRWLERVHMYAVERVACRYTHELSGGMAQRVAIALALAPRPRLVVADEPTTGLDATLRVYVLDLLARAVAEEGATLLLITHDMEAARLLAQDVAILCAGRVVETGPAAAVLNPGSRAGHPYTRYLLEAERRLAQAGGSLQQQVAGAFGSAAGCGYLEACPQRLPRCAEEAPGLQVVGGEHRVACWACSR